MLNFTTGQRIYLARAVCDMRRGAPGLAALVQHQFGRDPYAGDVFVFIGKDRNRLKLLVWDASGFWVCAKRLEKGSFALSKPLLAKQAAELLTLSPAEMHLLLEGIDVHRATYHAHYHRPAPVAEEMRK